MTDREPLRGTEIGAPRPRTEDLRLVTGRGRYTADLLPADACHAAFVRSPHAHAVIRAIDPSEALAVPGVLAVLTGADAAEDGIGPIPHNVGYSGPPDATLRPPEGFEVFVSDHRPLPAERVRFVGEPLAIVIAETRNAAVTGAELVDVDYDPLPAVTGARNAMAPDAPRVWDDCERNVALTCEVGDRDATLEAFLRAEHVVEFDFPVNRVTGTPLEPRAATGEFDAATGVYTLRAASGSGVVRTRDRLAEVLGVEPASCRVVFGDMGGNFGTRNAFFPEFAVLPWAARRMGRAVSWVASRLECFTSDYQARDFVSHAALALDAEGRFLALRGVNTVDLGAHTAYFWPLRKGLSMMQGTYAIPNVWFEGHAVFTNTAPTAVYRSAGRPEAIYVIERLIELAARACGFDALELRRLNLIRADQQPYTTAVGVTYDSGDYLAAMDRVLEEASWAEFPARRETSARNGRLRGIGLANYIEITSGIPRERAELAVDSDGAVAVTVGTMSSGQGHETSFPQLVSDWLEIPFERVRFVANDTDVVSVGGGSHSGRSMRLVSIAAAEAVDALIARGRETAAHLLQTVADEIRYAEGVFVASSGASVDLGAIARAAATLESLPEPLRGEFGAAGDITNTAGGYPYGAHVCEVEIDPETGVVEIVAWTGVDDVGLAVNPLILHGQAHGAIAQGVGQALCEAVVYDESGQLLTGSFMDYALPRSLTLPSFRTVLTEVPASSHPFGMRPGGEGGTTPALAAVVNAVVDALAHLGVEHVDLPVTSERIWRAINAGTSAAR